MKFTFVTRGGKRGGGEVSPTIFENLEKSTLILGKNVLIVAMYWLHFSCDFKSFQEKKPKILSCGAFLSHKDEMFIAVP